MSTTIRCTCGRNLAVRPEHYGKKTRCPNCGDVLSIPADPGDIPADIPDGVPVPLPAAGAGGSKEPTERYILRSLLYVVFTLSAAGCLTLFLPVEMDPSRAPVLFVAPIAFVVSLSALVISADRWKIG
jgi:hypothetical protein